MKLIGEVSYWNMKKFGRFGFGFIEVKTKMDGGGHAISRYFLSQKEVQFSVPDEVGVGNWVRFNPGPRGLKPTDLARAVEIEVFETREQAETMARVSAVKEAVEVSS